MSNNYFDIYMNGEILCSSEDNEGILSPEINKEINNAGTMSFTILPSHPRWAEVKRYLCYIDVEIYGKNVFRGRVTSVSQDFYGQKKVECEGALSFLNDSLFTTSSTVNDIRSFEFTYVPLILGSHNALSEDWKYFESGKVEFYGEANMIKNGTMISGYLSDSGDYVDSHDNGEIVSSVYISLESSKRYILSMDRMRYVDGVEWIGYASYDSNKEFISVQKLYPQTTGPISGYTLKTITIVPGNTIKYIRPMGAVNGSYIWLQELMDDDEYKMHDDSESVTGGEFIQTLEYISSSIIDGKKYMLRSSYSNGMNLLDILNPERDRSSSEIEFGVNLENITIEAPDIEAYSVIYPTTNGNPIYDSQFVYATYPIAKAVNLFGRIGKAFEVGNVTGQEVENRCKQIAELYDPLIPDSFTVTAFDQSIYLGNEIESMIDVGDPVHVYSEPHNIDTTMLCLSMRLNLYEPSNNEYKIGKYIPDGEDYKIETLTKSFADSKKKKK